MSLLVMIMVLLVLSVTVNIANCIRCILIRKFIDNYRQNKASSTFLKFCLCVKAPPHASSKMAKNNFKADYYNIGQNGVYHPVEMKRSNYLAADHLLQNGVVLGPPGTPYEDLHPLISGPSSGILETQIPQTTVPRYEALPKQKQQQQQQHHHHRQQRQRTEHTSEEPSSTQTSHPVYNSLKRTFLAPVLSPSTLPRSISFPATTVTQFQPNIHVVQWPLTLLQPSNSANTGQSPASSTSKRQGIYAVPRHSPTPAEVPLDMTPIVYDEVPVYGPYPPLKMQSQEQENLIGTSTRVHCPQPNNLTNSETSSDQDNKDEAVRSLLDERSRVKKQPITVKYRQDQHYDENLSNALTSIAEQPPTSCDPSRTSKLKEPSTNDQVRIEKSKVLLSKADSYLKQADSLLK